MRGSNTGHTGSQAHSAMSNAGWNALSTVLNMLISFVLAPIMIRYLGATRYGILLLIWSVTGVLGILNMGLGEATLRYVAYHFGDRNFAGVNRVMGSTLTFYAIIGAGTCAVLFGAAPHVAVWFSIPVNDFYLTSQLLRLSALVFSLGMLARVYGAIPMALRRYDISCKIHILQRLARAAGYIALVMTKGGLLQLVIWDLLVQGGTLCVQMLVARKIAPEIRLLPSFSFKGFREIAGYSVFSMLTYIFHSMHRECGKLVLTRFLGPAPVAYLGTPDNIAQRLHSVVASGSETLLPRFSANRSADTAMSMFHGSTWAALTGSITLLIPLIVLMPDFLRLWINPEFAGESADVGRLVALSYITQGAFTPAATFFRGTGKPWFVTIVIFFSGAITLLCSLLLVPGHGVAGVGYAYVLGSLAPLAGVFIAWFSLFGASAVRPLLRAVVLPLLIAGLAYVTGTAVLHRFAYINWAGILALGGTCAAGTGMLLFGADWLLGGAESPTRTLVARFGTRRLTLTRER